MKNKWYTPEEKLPEQGKKVLSMDQGDFFILQRFKDFWFSMPFNDSKYSRFHAPEMWQEIDFPNGFTGKIFVRVKDEFIDIDELEKKYPKEFDNFINDMMKHFKGQ